MTTRRVPSVTDSDFVIRTPAFMVINGHVLHVMNVQYNNERYLSVGDSVRYQKHGLFRVCCIHEMYAVICHTTVSGKDMYLLVPEKSWMNVSNGSYKVDRLIYPEGFEKAYAHLKSRPTAAFVSR